MDPTEDAQPVVDGDDDHIAVASQDAAVKHVAGSLHVGAAVDEDHHRFGAATLPNVCGDGDRKQAGGTGESTQTECDSRHRCTFFLKNLIGVFGSCFKFVFFFFLSFFVCVLIHIFFFKHGEGGVSRKASNHSFFPLPTRQPRWLLAS